MSSGGKGRSNKGSKGATERSNMSGGGSTHSHQTKSDHNHNEKDKDVLHKIPPTVDQLRLAQMIDNTHSEKVLQEKINQVIQVTSVSTDDAIIALHDCDNDVNAAIESLFEGEGQGEWKESTKKKKKAPATKSKEEAESNKENRRVENRERSGSRPRGGAAGPPRFRGRGGGRGGREETSEGVGRGSGGRRGRMANGTGPASRGRGSRGRGSSSANTRTFQKRHPQPPSFTETIDTWGPTPPETKIEDSANNLQIDNWDEEQSTTTEEWDSEWTGSLDKTTVFSPSTSMSSGGLTGPSPPQEPAPSISSGSSHTSTLGGSMNSVLGGQVNSTNNIPASNSNSSSPPSVSLPPPSLTESVNNVLSKGQAQLQSSSLSVSQSYSNVAPTPSSMSQSQAIDLALLLQKAAPHSNLGRLPSTPIVDGSSLVSSSLGVEPKSNILSAMTPSVGDSLKSGMLANNGGPTVASSAPPPQSYSPSSVAITNSMFSNSVSNLGGGSLNNNSGVSKVLSLSSQNASLASRTKPPSRRLPHTSKIPSKAVEMPEVAMAALDMQFTGLEFGTETFDFTSDVKPLMGSNLVTGTTVNSREPPSVPVSVPTKDLSGLSSTISQPQSLGPQPIPFPSQSTERKTQSSLLSGPQRPSAASAASVSAQSLADLTKKDISSGGPPLGSLVGSNPSGHSPYQSSSSAGYGPKASSFPSPPAHYAQNSSQNYSNSTSSGVSNSSYAGTNVNSSSGGSNSSSNNQTAGGYGSSFSAPAASGQYPNSYVNVSSHSLSSMSVSKAHGGLKDASQNYNDTSGTSSSLSGSLATSAGGGGGGGSSGSSLSASLNSAPTSSVPPSKPSVPGKTVNSLGSSVPPGVQQHSVSQQQHQVGQQQLSQHHQSHHHLQQQQQQQQVAQQTQQTQQLMAGPSQYVSPQQAALQGAMHPPFYNVPQTPMYSFEDLQVFQQRMPHMPQAPATMPGGREAAITSPPSYSVAEANKFRTDQNSSPVPSTISQQGAAGGATYITTPGNAGMTPFYMYQTMPTVHSSFSQYAAPTIIQIPSNSHTGSTTTQFPGPPKIPYANTSAFYDNMSQTQEYKTGYGSGSQGQNKTGPNSAVSASNSGTDLSGYKNHLGKVSRVPTYEKQPFHTGTPPPFNLPGSGTNPMTANYPPMFIPTMPAAQHHSPLMHHQLHQDGGSSAGQRSATGGGQNKGGGKSSYSNSYW